MGIFDKNNDSCSTSCGDSTVCSNVGLGSSVSTSTSKTKAPSTTTCSQPSKTPDTGFACVGNVSSQSVNRRRNRRR